MFWIEKHFLLFVLTLLRKLVSFSSCPLVLMLCEREQDVPLSTPGSALATAGTLRGEKSQL